MFVCSFLAACNPTWIIQCQIYPSRRTLVVLLTHSWVHTFPKAIYLKVNVIEQLKFELACYDSAVKHFNHYTTRTLSNTSMLESNYILDSSFRNLDPKRYYLYVCMQILIKYLCETHVIFNGSCVKDGFVSSLSLSLSLSIYIYIYIYMYVSVCVCMCATLHIFTRNVYYLCVYHLWICRTNVNFIHQQ